MYRILTEDALLEKYKETRSDRHRDDPKNDPVLQFILSREFGEAWHLGSYNDKMALLSKLSNFGLEAIKFACRKNWMEHAKAHYVDDILWAVYRQMHEAGKR